MDVESPFLNHVIFWSISNQESKKIFIAFETFEFVQLRVLAKRSRIWIRLNGLGCCTIGGIEQGFGLAGGCIEAV